MAAFLRKIGEVMLYVIMLALVAVCFTGQGLFIYEGF